MRFFFTICVVATSLLGVYGAHVPALANICSEDPCLALAIKQRPAGGRGGCKEFFEVTVLPANVTSFSTTSLPKTVTVNSTSVFYVTEHPGTKAVVHNATTFTSTSTKTLGQTKILTFSEAAKRAKRTEQPGVGALTFSATTMPHAISAVCKNNAQYSSACSCVGAVHRTSTLAPHTTTVTVSKKPKEQKTSTLVVNVTSTVQSPDLLTTSTTQTISTFTATTVQPEVLATNIVLEGFKLVVASNNSNITGQYVVLQDPEYGSSQAILAPANESNTVWTVNINGQWHSTSGYFAGEDVFSDPKAHVGWEFPFFTLHAAYPEVNYLFCGADAETQAFTCQNDGGKNTVWSVCEEEHDNYLVFGRRTPKHCDAVTLSAVFNGEQGASSSSGSGSASSYEAVYPGSGGSSSSSDSENNFGYSNSPSSESPSSGSPSSGSPSSGSRPSSCSWRWSKMKRCCGGC